MTKTKVRNIIRLSFAGLLLLVVFLSLNKFHDKQCNSMDITVMDSSDVRFVTASEVRTILYDALGHIQGYKMDSIDIYKLQNVLKVNPYVRESSIYKTISGVLKVDVQQRRPILMVMGSTQNYYIDGDACVFSTHPEYHCKTIVANGNIQDKFDFKANPVYKIDLETKTARNVTADLFKLAQLIEADDFWCDQIEQIYVTASGDYELVPMVGPQILALGSIDDYDRKMYVLKQFYLNAMNKVGWNTYQLISVKYNGQIVCKKFKEKNT